MSLTQISTRLQVCLADDTAFELHVKVKPRTTSWTRGFTILWDQHVLYKAMMDQRTRARTWLFSVHVCFRVWGCCHERLHTRT